MSIFDKILNRQAPEKMPIPSGTETEKTPPPTEGEILWADSNIYAAKDFKKYNEDDLVISKGNRIYKRMMRDDQVKACLRFKQYTVISRKYFFDVPKGEDGEPDQEKQKMADFFDAVLQHIKGSFSDKMLEMLSSMPNGFSIMEKVHEPFEWDGKNWWGLRDLKLKPFSTFNGGFTMDPFGNILKLEQMVGTKGVEIPLNKIIHFVHQPDIDRVYGESDLRAAYRNFWSKDIIIKFMNIFLERHASGFVWAKVTGSISQEQNTELKNLMKNISAKTSAIVPGAVDLQQMQPVRTDAFEKGIALHDKGISKSLLVPNLLGLSEQGDVGSYSQSQTQLDAFYWILEEIGNRLAEELNEQLFKELAIWNFGTDDFPPFRFEELSADKKAKIAEMWSNLVSKGSVTKSDSDEAYIRKMLGFPEKAEDEEPDPNNPEGGPEPFPQEGDLKDDETPPDNSGIIDGLPAERKETASKRFAERPWMRRVDFTAIKETLDRYDGELGQELADIMGKARFSIESQITKIVGERSLGNVKPKDIEGVVIPTKILSEMRRTLRDSLQAVLDKSYDTAKRELPKKKLSDIKYRPGMDKTQAERFLSSRAMKITGVIEQKTLQAVQTVLENGIRFDKSLAQVIGDIGNDTDLVSLLPKIDAAGKAVNVPARLETIARTNTSYAMNEARTALFNSPEMRGFVEAFEYSAILDDRTSAVCEMLDGKIEKDWGTYSPPNHFNCRSLLVPVTTIDEWDGKEDTIPGNVTPQKGFM